MNNARVIAVGAPAFRQEVAQVLGMSPESIDWVQVADAARPFVEAGTIAMVALAPEVPPGDALALAEHTAKASPTTAVVLVREKALDGELPTYLRAGIRDVVDLSLGGEELNDALTRAMQWAINVRSTQADGTDSGTGGLVLTVFSSKGGSGKSFLACNLATALADRSEQDTAVVDLDIAMGDVFSYFGKEPTHPIQDLMELGGKTERDSVLASGTKLRDHLWGYGTPPDPAAATLKSEEMERAIVSLRRTFDFVVLDAPASYSDEVLAALDSSDTIYLVAALDVVSIKHLSKAIETLISLRIDTESLRIVLNRADSKVGLTPQDVERVLKVTIDAMIPSSRAVPSSLNKGIPVYLDDPKSEVTKSIAVIADRIIESTGKATMEVDASKRKRFGLSFGKA